VNPEKVIPIEKKKPAPKVKVEALRPQHVIDAWLLLEQSLKAVPQHPSIDEEEPRAIRAHLYQLLSSPGCVSAIARVNRKPVGLILAEVHSRPFGSPRAYLSIWSAWVTPAHRRQGVMRELVAQLSGQAKQLGVHHWEAQIPSSLLTEISKVVPARALSVRIGEKIPLK
jgi:GNAT superfamily N-acetyltransferase